jgi:hypothetical protein
MRLLLLIGTSGFVCFAQSLSMGVVGGLRVTDDIRSGQINTSAPNELRVAGGTTSESKRYVVGPAIEVALPFRLAVEFDALYRREGYRSGLVVTIPLVLQGTGPRGGSLFSQERAHSWEFPLLLKYKIPFSIIQPYIEAGYGHRMIDGSINSHEIINVNAFFPPHRDIDFQSRSSTNWQDSQGVIAGLGLQFAVGRLSLTPEVRYTWWSNAAIQGSTTITALGEFGVGPGFESARNQVDVQLGLRWRIH